MGDESSPAAGPSPTVAQGQTTQDLLADIFGTNDEMPSAAAVSPTSTGQPAKSSMNDILGLFDSTSISTPTSPSPYSSPPPQTNPMGDLFSAVSSTPSAPSPPIPQAPHEHEVYNAHGLRITLTGVRDSANPLVANILAKFSATVPAQGVSFQAAVPKAQRLQMMAMSKTDVAPGATETQQLRVMAQTPGVRSLYFELEGKADCWRCRLSSACVFASRSRRLGRRFRTRPTSPSRRDFSERGVGVCDRGTGLVVGVQQYLRTSRPLSRRGISISAAGASRPK